MNWHADFRRKSCWIGVYLAVAEEVDVVGEHISADFRFLLLCETRSEVAESCLGFGIGLGHHFDSLLNHSALNAFN